MRILLISNDSSRTGAPFVVLNLARWIKTRTEHDCDILVRKGGGALEPLFKDVARTQRYDELVSDRRLVRRLCRRAGIRRLGGVSMLSAVERRYADSGIDVILSNTVTNGGVCADLAGLGCPVVTYVHELASMIAKYGETNWSHVNRHTVRFLAGSGAVAEHLRTVRGVPAERVDTVQGFISVEDLEGRRGRPGLVRERLGIDAGTFVVGGAGFTNHRKGKDLFVQMAAHVREAAGDRPVCFMWIGGTRGDAEARQMEGWIRDAGFDDNFFFIPGVDNHVAHTAAMDVLCTTSREDPYPLTNLEAGLLGIPVVCFEGTGGSPEFVEQDAGCVVAHLDVRAMAECVLALYEDEPLRRRLGACAREKVRERHDVAVAAPAIMACLERVVRSA